jgi:uncharacterized LabA/DUF88 family protein
MVISIAPGAQPKHFQRAMVFVDGTNLFHRLVASKLKLRSLRSMCHHYCQGRQIVRIYLYTTAPHFEKAKQDYDEKAFEAIRVVFGDAVPTDKGVKEKGVDALLVADLVYHAAAKNYDYAVLVSTDADFAHALKRVEDFGCRTAVVSVCANVPRLLREAADEVFEANEDMLLSNKWAYRD